MPGTTGPWSSSYDALLHTDKVILEVSASMGNSQMAPVIPSFSAPPAAGGDATEYIDAAVARSLSIGSLLLGSYRDVYGRLLMIESRLASLETR